MSHKSLVKTLLNSTAAARGPVKPLVWIDCEMTGLDVQNDHIIEICCVITDGDLKLVEEFYESTVYYPKARLDQMNEWCTTTHKASGLYDKVLSDPSRTLPVVQKEVLAFLKKYISPNKAILAGNSVHMDKFFMMREFPDVIDYLHYRILDVSTIFEFGYRHNPELMKYQPPKKKDHTAKSDILESINQLKFFRENYFKDESEVDFTKLTKN